MYDGFISYSHAADGLLAPRLQAGLQKFAKPWWKRRAVRIFRDESSLSANPHLWSSITEALDTSGWFVLLLSPDAAQSEWVNQEIAYWTTNRDPKRILPVVTDGTFGWVDGEVVGDAVPDALRGVFSEEPRWVDFRWARDEDQLDLQDPRFADAVADIASTIRGIPKDDLASEEVRQHRRTVRTAWAAGIVTAVMAVAAVGFAVSAQTERERADEEATRASQEADRANDLAEQEAAARRQAVANAEEAERSASLAEARELAASAINVLDEDPQLAILLTLEAIKASPSGEDQPPEVVDALWQAGFSNRLLRSFEHEFGGFTFVALSPDKTRLAVVTSEGRQVRLYRVPEFELLWSFSQETSDSFAEADFSPDGSQLSVAVVDSESALTARLVAEPDDLPNRVIVLDVATGSETVTLEFPFCLAAETMAWSPDGAHLAVAPGPPGAVPTCVRPESQDGAWAEIFETRTWESVEVIDVPLVNPAFDAVAVQYDQSGRLYLFAGEGPRVYEAGTYELLRTYDFRGGRAVSPDGSVIADFSSGAGGAPGLYSTDTGLQVDKFAQYDAFPQFPRGIGFSSDGRYVFTGTDGAYTLVWDTADGEQVFRLPGGPSFNSAFDESRKLLYTSHYDGSVKVWNLGPGGYGLATAGDIGAGTWVNANQFTIGPGLGAFVAVDLNAFTFTIQFFDADTGQLDDRQLGGNWPQALPDGRFLYQRFPNSDEWVIYDPTGGEEMYLAGCAYDPASEICLDGGEPAKFAIAHVPVERDQIIIEDGLGIWTVFDLAGNVIGEETHDLDGQFFAALEVSADWVLLDAGSTYGAVDRQTNDVLWRSEFAKPAGGVDVRGETSNGGDFAAVIEGARIRIVEFGQWTDRVLPFTFGRIRGIGLSRNDRLLALGDEDRVSIVDLSTDEIVQTVPLGGVSDFYWLDDTTLLVGAQGLWARLTLDFEDLVDSVTGGLTRTLTEQECATYRIDQCPTLDEVRSR